jgi:hypothetical protein
MVASTSDPVLDDGDLDRLVSFAATTDAAGNPPGNVATIAARTASTTYSAGQLVKVSTRFWRCIIPGTTATTPPSWPDLTGQLVNDMYTVVDGTVTWADNGTLWRGTWNLNAAAAEGWRWKAAKLAGAYDFTTDGQTFQRSQAVTQCNEMAQMYARRSGPLSLLITAG